MKALVVYDSQFGNTERLARLITETLIKHMTVRLLAAHEAAAYDLEAVDLLVLGCPTQKHDITPDFETVLNSMPPHALEGKATFVFDTRFRGWKLITGSAADHLGKRLEALGAVLITPPESFFVTGIEGPLEEGEARRAVNWARAMLSELNVTI
ncbi:MAG: flavodoxin domain-containing protein [Anaerolineae bacterium]